MSEGRDYGSDISSLWSEVRSLKSDVRDVRGDVYELRGDLQELRRYIDSEIERLEREMREIGEMIVDAINRQTTAVVGGVAATTVMIERTKNQIETDFVQTREKLDLQTESTLQIEIGKKVADLQSLKGKLDAFVGDIKTRFDKSLESVALNRELYNVNFRKIYDEYDQKIKTIGSHIFQIKLEDIAPAVEASVVPYETAHSLPIEMDIHRLDARSENLDETLKLLRASRLDIVLNSVQQIDSTLARYDCGELEIGKDVQLCVEGIFTLSESAGKLCCGLNAETIEPSTDIRLRLAAEDLAVYSSDHAVSRLLESIPEYRTREASSAELMELGRSIESLQAKGLISSGVRELLTEFLESGNLEFIEG